MTGFPTITGELGLGGILAAALVFLIAYIGHEAWHVGTLRLFGIDHEIDYPTTVSGMLFSGVGIEFNTAPPRWQVVTVALSPLFLAGPAVLTWAVVLTLPSVHVGTLAMLAAWFVAAFPSLKDWQTAFRYSQVAAEAEGAGTA